MKSGESYPQAPQALFRCLRLSLPVDLWITFPPSNLNCTSVATLQLHGRNHWNEWTQWSGIGGRNKME